MAVEILKRGTVKRKYFFGTCDQYTKSCGTEIRFLQEDSIAHHPETQRDSEYATVRCPVCAELIYGYPRTMEDEYGY